MTNLSKVVWSEGMHLGPHHFQAQARFFENSIHFVTSSLSFAASGLTGCSLDEEALRNGTVAVRHARGIFPDGLVFCMPESDRLPEPRAIGELFSPLAESLIVYLAIPRYRSGGRNFAAETANSTRFVAETETVADETTGSGDKRIQIGRKNISLLLGPENLEDYDVLPLARILRDGSGQFVYDSRFIPPVLQIGASPRLVTIIHRLIEILDEKSRSLVGSGQPSAARAGASPREIASFWFLHAVNSSLTPLRHHLYSTRSHPEAVYVTLARLAGALCTFTMDGDATAVPQYDHDRLTDCFDALDAFIRRRLEIVIPTNCLTISLEPVGNYIFAGATADARCFGRANWILAVRSRAAEAEMMEKVPALVKVCSTAFIQKLVQRALPGLSLTHLPVPPAAVSPKLGWQYFSIAREGPCWDHIQQTRGIGVYVPAEFAEAEVEIDVLLDTGAT